MLTPHMHYSIDLYGHALTKQFTSGKVNYKNTRRVLGITVVPPWRDFGARQVVIVDVMHVCGEGSNHCLALIILEAREYQKLVSVIEINDLREASHKEYPTTFNSGKAIQSLTKT